MEKLLLVALLISMFCVGLRIISSKGMIFYFLRIPYEKMIDRKKVLKELIQSQRTAADHMRKVFKDSLKEDDNEKSEKFLKTAEDLEKTAYEYERDYDPVIKRLSIMIYLLKPVIGCGTCMASVWTIVWWWLMMDEPFSQFFVLTAFVVATLNSLIFALYEVMTKYIAGK